MPVHPYRVQILLSTYNGEQYLEEQLNSYMQLENRDIFCVLIRDDGSTDGTRAILEKYAENPMFCIEYGEHAGYLASYRWLIYNADLTCDYFAFSDQDDVWLPGKLATAVAALDAESPSCALLFATASNPVSFDLKPLCTTKAVGIRPSYFNAMIQNVLPGHTQVANRTLMQSVRQHDIQDAVAVDWWFYLVGSGIGKILFSETPGVLYRQYDGNTIGDGKNGFETLLRRLRYLRKGKGQMISDQLLAFYQSFRDELPERYRIETERFLRANNRLWKRIAYICRCRAFRQDALSNVMFRLLYILGVFTEFKAKTTK